MSDKHSPSPGGGGDDDPFGWVPPPPDPWADYEPMSDDELRSFVNDLHSGLVFTSFHLDDRPEMLPLVFMPIALGAFANWQQEHVEQLGVIWERMSERGPRSINGYPVFFSMRLMKRDEWNRAHKAATQLARLKEEIEI